ncbi:MAG TPA: DUF4388 domain-containing protein [Acidimicrobiales bacterium]|nr:DUF4388 domain-containing protein [Acidimicrobiales bacterium]
MTQTSAAAPEAEPVLVGSLGAFALPDVLAMAAASGACGRLAVTAAGVDGHLWMEDGELTGFLAGDAATLNEAVFDLALVTDGWFSFFPGGEAPAATGRCSVSDVLAEVEPQVAEWHDLVRRVSLDGLVHLSPTAPGAEVQIRADQWHLLTTISPIGSRVRDVLDAMGSQYVVALRLVCELLDCGLIETVGATVHDHVPGPASMATAAATAATAFPGASWVPPRFDAPPATPGQAAPAATGQPVPPSEVEVLPPPASGDPWVPPPLGHEPVAAQNGWSA